MPRLMDTHAYLCLLCTMQCAEESWHGPVFKEFTTKLETGNPEEWKEINCKLVFTEWSDSRFFFPLLPLHIFKFSTVNILF